MGNKRQREAKKKFREANGIVSLPNPGNPGAPKDNVDSDTKEKKRKIDGIGGEKSTGEGRERHSGNQNPNPNFTENGFPKKKHPLRVPGNRPGESCFICKGGGHLAKFCPKKLDVDRKKMCLLCRRLGHTFKSCPENPEASEREIKICYNCGKTDHRLADCPEPKTEGTPHATCFVCGEKGHLSRECPSNANGVYPKGGSCKVCGKVTHLARDCPDKGNEGIKITNDKNPNRLGRISTGATPGSGPGMGGKRIVFQSGDDLDDDFGDIPLDGVNHDGTKDIEIGDDDGDDNDAVEGDVVGDENAKTGEVASRKKTKNVTGMKNKHPKVIKF